MRRILTKFLNQYSRWAVRTKWNYQFTERMRDANTINRLLTRRRFLTTATVNFAFSAPYNFHDVLVSAQVSPIDKLLLLSGLKYFDNSAALKAMRDCTQLGITEYNIGCAVLNISEAISLIYLILKKYYPIKDQCDMKYYLKHLNTYIPWQALTSPLKRFPIKERKVILDTVGKTISTLTESEAMIRNEVAISIW